MKSLTATLFLIISSNLTLLGTTSIDISKPVGQSIRPDSIYWNFDHGSINHATPNPTDDESGNGYSGYLKVGNEDQIEPTYTEGKFGTAIRIHGADDEARDPYVGWTFRDSPDSDITKLDLAETSFTAGAWIKLDTINEKAPQVIVVFERGRSADTSSYYSFHLVKLANDTWTLRFNIPHGYFDAKGTPRTTVFNDGNWHHVAFSFEAGVAGGSSTLTFWLDGEVFGEPLAIDLKVPKVTDDQDRIFSVGERNLGYFRSSFDGSIDDVFITTGVMSFKN